MKTHTGLMIISLLCSVTLSAQINIKKLKKDTYQLNEQVIDLSVIDNSKASPIEKKQFRNLSKKIIDNLQKSSDIIKDYKKDKAKYSAISPKYLKKYKEEIRAKLEAYDNSNQLAMVSLKESLQKIQQVQMTISNIQKAIHDSQQSTLRKLQ